MGALVFVLVTVAAALLVGAYLALSAANARLSGEIWQLHNQMAETYRQSSWLETEIARLSSIPVLQARSVALGYQPSDAIEYVKPEAP
jgi:hypothetical protein